MAATQFVRPAVPAPATPTVSSARVGDVLAIAERIVGNTAAEASLREYFLQTLRPLPRHTDPADRGLMQHMERVLAGAIGASSARLMFTHALRGRGLAAEEVAELLDETSQELRFSRQLLQATMENVAQGISVADSEARLVAWNGRYLEMFDYPTDMIRIGRPVADLIRWNASARRVRRDRSRGTDQQAHRPHARRHALRDPAPAPQRARVRDAWPADAGRRLRHDLHRHHGIQAQRAAAARGQADARAARIRTHAGAVDRAAGRSRRQACRRAGQCHQDAVRRRREPRPAAAAERRPPVCFRVERCAIRCGLRARDRGTHRRLAARSRGSTRRHARHRPPRERLDAGRDHRLRPR